MRKLLSVLVIVFLLLSAAALTLGILLFGKRELLKGRTQKLEKFVMQVVTTVEQGPATIDRKPEYPARDTSPVTAEVLDNPELSTFWDSYSNALEVVDQATLSLEKQKIELMKYYKIDPATQKPMRDPLGQPIIEGEGTMQGILDDVLAKATAQYNRLNDTRRLLKSTREELVTTTTDLNAQKKQLRLSLKEIEGLKADITRLNGDIAKLKQRVDEITEEKKQLEEQVTEQKKQLALLDEQVKEKDAKIAQLKKELEKCQGNVQIGVAKGTDVMSPGQLDLVTRKWEPGQKGSIVAVNPEYNFVVVQLTDAFLEELLGKDLSAPVPTGVELMVRQPGDAGKFVTKIRIATVKRAEKLAVCDVLLPWKQMEVEKGYVVFHQ